MSYSILSLSSSSVDLLIPTTTWKDRAKSYWPILWKVCVVVACVAVVGLVVFDIRRKQADDNVLKGIKCMECAASQNMNTSEHGLAYEEKCETSPKNIRRCASGQVCVSGYYKRGYARIFFRSCTDEDRSKEMKCISFTKPTVTNLCYCNTELCNKN